MRRPVRYRVNQLSMNLLISYLSILIAPLLAIVIIYFTATSLLLSVQKEKMFHNAEYDRAGGEPEH